MDSAASDCVAIYEAVVFLEHFKDLPDPRQRGKVVYPLDEVLLFCLLAVLGGAETFVDIARFGEKKINLLRRFRPFRDGTPSHDHLGDIFATLDAGQFQRCFVAWVAALTGTALNVPGMLDLPHVEAVLADLISDLTGTIQHAAEDLAGRVA